MEPSLAFAPDGALLFQAWELSSQPGGLPPRPVLLRHDGADTWTDASPGPVPHPTSLDPYLYVDPATGRIFTLDWIAGANPYCSTISHSDDGARTWVTSPLACGGYDGESITAGPPVSSPTIGYPNIVYYCTGASLGTGDPLTTPVCTKSLDGGLTFTPTGGYPYEDVIGSQDVFPGWPGNPVVDQRGRLFVPKRHLGDPWVAISRDEGLTWARVRVATNGAAGAATRMAVASDGSLAYTWTGADHLPYIARSADGGQTWSTPLMIAPPEVDEAALPRIVAGPDGALAVAYVATENGPGAPYYDFCNVHLGDCTDGRYEGVAWDGYLATIPAGVDPVIRTATAGAPGAPLLVGGCSADGGCKAVLDFIDLQFDGAGVPWAAFVDDCAIVRDFVPLFSPGLPRCGDGVGEGVVLTLA